VRAIVRDPAGAAARGLERQGAVARPLIEGLRTGTVVTDPRGALPFGIEPLPFDAALRAGLQEERAEG
jgi:hypothetical protein